MFKNLRVIVAYLIFIVVCCTLYEFYSDLEYFENLNMDIGNRISEYFYRFGVCILQKTDYRCRENYKGTVFFEHLPTNIPYDAAKFDQIRDEFVRQQITEKDITTICGGCDMWEIHYDKIYHFWKAMRTLVHSMMDDAFSKSGLKPTIDNPIIHFRCADTPFIKQQGYHLQYYKFFKTALERINATRQGQGHYSRVTLMSCNTHRTNAEQKKACSEYTDSLKTYLNEIGYQCDVVCGSNIDDFAAIFYAPAVISTSSSFSFMSGFFGNGVFISTENTIGRCDACNDWMLYDYNLPHEDVEDYTKTDSVIPLLSK
jgi:hypothetical protein